MFTAMSRLFHSCALRAPLAHGLFYRQYRAGVSADHVPEILYFTLTNHASEIRHRELQ